jgi:hypothetical protein
MNPQVNSNKDNFCEELNTEDKHKPYTPSSTWFVEVQVWREPTTPTLHLRSVRSEPSTRGRGTKSALSPTCSSLTPYSNFS